MTNKRRRLVFIILLSVAVLYSIVCLVFYFVQDSFFYFPDTITQTYNAQILNASKNIEQVTLTADDGTKLHGWLVKNGQAEKSPLVIYYGGAGQELSTMISGSELFLPYSLLLVNYRGYGLSEGKPTEEKLCEDAVLIYDTVTQRDDIDKDNIVLMGYSIGTGVAVNIASKRAVKGVILAAPFDKYETVVQQQTKILPLFWVLRDKYDSASLAPAIKAPLLALIPEKDNVIPRESAVNLSDNWGGESQTVIIKGANHETILASAKTQAYIETFLRQLTAQ